MTAIRLSFPVLYQELGMRKILASDGTSVLKVGYIAPVADPVPGGPRFAATLYATPGAPGHLPHGESSGGTAESLDKLADLLRQRLAERGTWWETAEHPFDAGEGSRELSGPGRDLLREAIAEQDADEIARDAS